MAHIKLKIGRKRYRSHLPGEFSGLSRRQAIRVAYCYLQLDAPLAPERVNGIVVKSLTNPQRFALLQAVLNIPPDDFFKLGELAITSLLESSLFHAEQHDILTGEPVLKYVSLSGVRCYLPALAMSNAPLIQFVWAEEYYQNLQNEQDFERNIDGLVSVLCAHPLRLLAMKLNLGTRFIDWDHHPVLKLPMAVKFAVLQYYHGTRGKIRQAFSPMFTAENGGGDVGPDYTSKYRWWALTHDLAEKGVFGNFEQTCYTNLHNVLHHVSYNSDKYKESEIKRQINRKHG